MVSCSRVLLRGACAPRPLSSPPSTPPPPPGPGGRPRGGAPPPARARAPARRPRARLLVWIAAPPPPRGGGAGTRRYSFETLVAWGPFGPWLTSNSTDCPSRSDLKPSPWMAVWRTKRSFDPSSGARNPDPFWSLNHFTVPFAMLTHPLPRGGRMPTDTQKP